MFRYVIIAVLVLNGLQLASWTYRAGLRYFAGAIAVTNILGFGLLAMDVQTLGWVIASLSMVLVFWSRRIMKAYRVGPFATRHPAGVATDGPSKDQADR